MKKRSIKVLSLILPLAFAMAMLIGMTVTANALEAVTYIDHDADGTPKTETCDSYTVVQSGSTLPESANGWYVVKDSSVDISRRIAVNGTVNMILVNDSYLFVNGGFDVKKGATLNIYSQSGDNGRLFAIGSDKEHTAGIGVETGSVNIHGGIVGAVGGSYAAGIGGDSSENGGKVTIYGGYVTALGNKEGGAGIGGGIAGDGGEVTIFGGEVDASGTSAAEGSSGAAGIGGGLHGKGGKVTIYGGYVETSGDTYQGKHVAGIGAGFDARDGSDGELILGEGVTLYGGDRRPSTKLDKGPKNYTGNRYKYMKTETAYKVTFVDGYSSDGVLKTEFVEKGQAATAPEEPTRAGYDFNGWDTDFSNVKKDLTVTARWKQATYRVTFTDGYGTVLKEEDVLSGRSATPPEDPSSDGVVFSGWKPDYSCVMQDLKVEAQWTPKTPGKCTVVFVFGFGNDPVSQDVQTGDSATEPTVIPVVDGFDFERWDKSFVDVQSDLTVNAMWKKRVPQGGYTVTFHDGYSGRPPVVQRVADGKAATAPEDPTRDGYIFDGWDTDFSCVTSNLQVIAQWKQIRLFTVVFVDGQGNTLKEEVVEEGKAATAPEAPAREGYTFDGWDPSDFSKITKDMTVTAKWKKIDPAPTPQPEKKISGTPFTTMKAKGKTSLVFSWKKVSGADGYDIFLSRCNSGSRKYTPEKVKTIKGNKTFRWTGKGLKKNTAYKGYVKAYVVKDGKKTYVRKSPLMRAYTSGGTKKYTNAKSVTVNKKTVSLKKGKTFRIKARVNKLKKSRALMSEKTVAAVRYLSTNKKIATVNRSGRIKGVSKGTCHVYAYAHNGVLKKIKVTVR